MSDVQYIRLAHSARHMPRIDNSQLSQPQLIVFRPADDSPCVFRDTVRETPALYLEIPIVHLVSLCERPRKYHRYIGWCIMDVGTYQIPEGLYLFYQPLRLVFNLPERY